jgi:hypothetical protein
MLAVRRVGYEIAEAYVDLREGTTTTRDLQLQRIVSLDSVKVVAMRDRYPEFSWNKRFIIEGSTLDMEAIQKRRPPTMRELIAMTPHFRVIGEGYRAKVVPLRLLAAGKECGATVVIDGMEATGINDLPVSEVGAVEAYTMGPLMPSGFTPGCGVIKIWTKR